MSAKRGQPMAEAVQWPPGTIQSHCGAVAPLAVSLSCTNRSSPATTRPPHSNTVISSGRCLELGVVKRIYTDLAVVAVSETGFKLVETAPGIGADEVRTKTAAPLT